MEIRRWGGGQTPGCSQLQERGACVLDAPSLSKQHRGAGCQPAHTSATMSTSPTRPQGWRPRHQPRVNAAFAKGPVGSSEWEPVVTPGAQRGDQQTWGRPGLSWRTCCTTEILVQCGKLRQGRSGEWSGPCQVLSQTGLKAKHHSPRSKGAYGLGGGSAQAHYPKRREPVEGRQPRAGKAMPRGPQPATLPGPSRVSLQGGCLCSGDDAFI